MRSASRRSPSRTGIYTPAACPPQSMIQRAEVRDQRSKSEKGRRSTSAIRSQAVVTADEPSQFLIFSEFLLSNA